MGGSVAEWLACWTKVQKGPCSNRTLRQTVHTHCASVHQAAKLITALLKVTGVTAGLAESNGSLPPGLWLASLAGWLPGNGISSGTLRSVIEYGLPFYRKTVHKVLVSNLEGMDSKFLSICSSLETWPSDRRYNNESVLSFVLRLWASRYPHLLLSTGACSRYRSIAGLRHSHAAAAVDRSDKLTDWHPTVT